MKNNYFAKKLILLAPFTIASMMYSQTLVHYWNFNNNSSVPSITTPNISLVSGAALTALNTANSTIDASGGTGQGFDVANLNARNGDPAGTHLRYNNPIGGQLNFALPTTGFKDVVVKFTTRRSSSGAGTQTWSYTTDGTNYKQMAIITPIDGNPVLQTLDFTAIPEVNNNPNFKLKVEFSQGTAGTVGNNRFDNFTVDANTASATDNIAPTVTVSIANNATNVGTNATPVFTFNESVRLANDAPLTNANAAAAFDFRENDAAGAAVAFTTEVSGNSVKLIPTKPLFPNKKYYIALKPNAIEDVSNNAAPATTSTFTTASTSVSFASNFITVNEDAGTLTLAVNVTSPSDATVDLVVKGAPYSTADQNDFTLATQKLTITPSSPGVINITIPIINDSVAEQQAEYFVLKLENPNGTLIGANALTTVYILDDETKAPTPSKQIELNYIGSFDPSGSNNSTTEIVAHDPATQRLFTTSSLTDILDIVDFSNPAAPSVVKSINMAQYGGLTSVAVKNGIVAVASPNANPQLNGSVVFFNTNGDFLKQITVGALPDMVTFTPDGTKVITANEGEPNADYSVDPEGSVTVIDISGGIATLSQSNATTILFTEFNSQEGALVASGVRKLKASSTLSQDMEPEYVAVTADSKKAYVTIQESNAMAEIDLATKTITALWALGKKDMSIPGNGFDASDNNGKILIANWPVKSFYIPDAVQTYKVNGTNFVVTANEGDEREFAALNERTTVGASNYILDPMIFPQAEMLKQPHNLGRFRVTNLNGNTDGDAEFEEINSVGARSFSIFNADTKSIVFDSGDQFERYTAAYFPTVFNSDHESNAPKNRSRAKGPEPEGVALGTIGGQTFAFISLERVGGVMVYNITDPSNPVFVDYKNTRSTSAYGGDNGAEGILYIPAENSPTKKPYVIVANEISGTLTMYEIDQKVLSTGAAAENAKKTFSVFPNPAPRGTVYFNRPVDYKLYDVTGKLLQQGKNAKTADASSLSAGMYIITTSEGNSTKLLVK